MYAHKEHGSFNAQIGLMTTTRASPGSAYDGHFLPTRIEEDLEQEVPMRAVTAERGYDYGENHEFLREKGIDSAIHLNSYRTKMKDENKEIWVRLCIRHPEEASASEGEESSSCQRGIRERKQIEGKVSLQGPVGRGDEEASWVWTLSVLRSIALRHTGLPDRHSGEPEEDNLTPHRGGA